MKYISRYPEVEAKRFGDNVKDIAYNMMVINTDNGNIPINIDVFNLLYKEGDIGEVSDGYHTFNELYDFRMIYNAGFFNFLHKEGKVKVIKSRKHHDGHDCFGGGWFIVQAELPTGQISNHYEDKYWDMFKIPEMEIGLEYDGHSPDDVRSRLKDYLLQNTKVELMNFGEAIELLKQGKSIRRRGWNGKGLVVFKQVPSHIGSDIIPKMQSLPQSAKDIIMEGTGFIDYTSQCLIYDQNIGRADSWVPSISDIFAEDWEIVR